MIDGPGGQIELVNLTKTYDRAPVLKGINLTIHSGEFFSLLGPSGCGKTTTLRLIGGFESADSGEVRIDGIDMADVAAVNGHRWARNFLTRSTCQRLCVQHGLTCDHFFFFFFSFFFFFLFFFFFFFFFFFPPSFPLSLFLTLSPWHGARRACPGRRPPVMRFC